MLLLLPFIAFYCEYESSWFFSWLYAFGCSKPSFTAGSLEFPGSTCIIQASEGTIGWSTWWGSDPAGMWEMSCHNPISDFGSA